MSMTSDHQRRVMWVIAVVLVMTLFGITANLSKDERGTFGTVGLWLQVVGAVGMVVGLVLMVRERRRDQR